MKETRRQNHVIDSIFPIVLFFLFTVCAVVVLLLATNVYKSIANCSYRNNTSRTAVSYISEKIHQNDCASVICADTLDDITALKIIHSGEKEGYTTYIYCHEGTLKELLIRNEVEADAYAGSFIANMAAFDVTVISPGLFELTCTDKQGNHFQTLVATRSTTER